LPDDCADRCRRLAHALRLPVAGIDLRRTPQGEWYCFEVNPSPAFSYYEAATHQPIAEAIAGLLMASERSLDHDAILIESHHDLISLFAHDLRANAFR
jgi:glutathione synthase/RimK-type ligase-like ATP-grasp enzyme